MESFSSELKKAREVKHLTLSDVSDMTAINVRFLEAIEQGNSSILPAPYVRAFIREYANAVGLNPAEVLHHYDQGTSIPTTESAPTVHPRETPVPGSPAEPPEPSEHKPLSARIGRYAIVAIVLAVVCIGLWNMWRPPNRTPEIPVAGTSRDGEPLPSIESKREEVPAKPEVLQPLQDSLMLSGTAKDSVWMLLQVDNLPAREFLLHAGQKISWRAHARFLVTLGNAGGVEFMLNNKPLGTLGKRGAVVRDMEISRRLLTLP